MKPLTACAPAKINLCLFLGALRRDGRHELVSVMQSVSLADEVRLLPAAPDAAGDEVVCPGVEGLNLAGAALATFRARTGWDAPPLRIEIDKRIPVAAGMAGGSADAAAVLRLAAHASGQDDPAMLLELAAVLGSDVPGQLRPGRVLATGAGEVVERLDGAWGLGVLVIPLGAGLSTADVYAEADRLGLGRSGGELAGLLDDVRAAAAAPLPSALMVNDLEPAARSLEPAIEGALELARGAGADVAMVSGSGPTVLGLFPGPDGRIRAREAASGLQGAVPPVLAAEPVDAAFAQPREIEGA